MRWGGPKTRYGGGEGLSKVKQDHQAPRGLSGWSSCLPEGTQRRSVGRRISLSRIYGVGVLATERRLGQGIESLPTKVHLVACHSAVPNAAMLGGALKKAWGVFSGPWNPPPAGVAKQGRTRVPDTWNHKRCKFTFKLFRVLSYLSHLVPKRISPSLPFLLGFTEEGEVDLALVHSAGGSLLLPPPFTASRGAGLPSQPRLREISSPHLQIRTHSQVCVHPRARTKGHFMTQCQVLEQNNMRAMCSQDWMPLSLCPSRVMPNDWGSPHLARRSRTQERKRS